MLVGNFKAGVIASRWALGGVLFGLTASPALAQTEATPARPPGFHAAAAARAGVTDNSAAVAASQTGSITDTFAGARVEGGWEGRSGASDLLATYNAALNVFMRNQRTSVIQTLNLQSNTHLGQTAELGFRASGQYGLIGDIDTLLSPTGQSGSLDLGTDTTRPTGSVRVVRLAGGDHLVWRPTLRTLLDQRTELAWVSPSGPDSPLQRSLSGTADNVFVYRWERQSLGARVRGDALRAYQRELSSQVVLPGRQLAALTTTAFVSHAFTPLWQGQAEGGSLLLFPDSGASRTTYAGRLATIYSGYGGANFMVEALRGARPNPLIGEIFITDRLMARYGQPMRKLNGFTYRVEGGVMREETVAPQGEDPVRLRVAYATLSAGYGISRNLSVSLNYQLRVQRADLNPEASSARFPSYTRNLFFVSLEGRVPHAAAGAPLD